MAQGWPADRAGRGSNGKCRLKYRVDNVPWIWRPFWLFGSWLAGLAWWLVFRLAHLTCRIRYEGREHLEGRENFIYCLWHEYWFLWCVTFVRSHHRHVWMQHPAAYMKPVHVSLGLMGIRIVLGSGGEEGRRAADRLAEEVRRGASTTISPDGPDGPPHEFKKGVLQIALRGGVPVLPVRFVASPALVLPTWDRKIFPLPFARVTVVFDEPVQVTKEGFEEAARMLASRMTRQEGDRCRT